MANDKDSKGFSGLSDLASDVKNSNRPLKSEHDLGKETTPPNRSSQHQTTSSESDAKSSSEAKDTARRPSKSQKDAVIPEPNVKSSAENQSIETVQEVSRSTGFKGKWFWGIAAIAMVLWLINSEDGNNKPSYSSPTVPKSYSSPQSNPAPQVSAPKADSKHELQYVKPSVGRNNVLTVKEIRWCTREGIRIEAMRTVIDTNKGATEFNRIVDDYNARCGSFRYRQGSLSRAERDVETFRNLITAQAIQEAKGFARTNRPSYSSKASAESTSAAPKKPNARLTREAQRLLTELGYAPGPVDGDYGRQTADAVKAFQRAKELVVDGWVSESLVEALRSAKTDKFKYQTATGIQINTQKPNRVPDTSKKISEISVTDQAGIIEACKYRGSPANVYSCQQEELRKLKRIGTAPDLSRLSYEDRTGIINACKYRGSPANVYSCQQEELRKLKRIGTAPDLSRLSYEDRTGIINACKYRGSPANVYTCQKEELNKLNRSGTGPDLSKLSSADRSGIIDACKYRGSPANVYTCQKEELNKLRRIGSGPDLSRLASFDRSGIITACKYRGSPANVYSCQKEELKKLKQVGPAPDLSGLSSSDRSGIITACKYRGSPANIYNCQKQELNKLRALRY